MDVQFFFTYILHKKALTSFLLHGIIYSRKEVDVMFYLLTVNYFIVDGNDRWTLTVKKVFPSYKMASEWTQDRPRMKKEAHKRLTTERPWVVEGWSNVIEKVEGVGF